MSRFSRIRRRPDHWRSPHDRARARAAERLDGPLGLAEAAWLDAHLVSCPACASIAASYEADRQALRGLRANLPEPPRDLWARTASAIERESATGSSTADRPASSRASRVPFGPLAGVAVIALVVGVSTLSGGLFRWGAPSGVPDSAAGPSDVAVAQTPDGGPSIVEATPMAVGPGHVAWIDKGPGGRPGYSAVTIDEVCPAGTSGCPMIGEGQRESLGLANAPRTIFGSPDRQQAIAISDNGDAGVQLLIVQLPQADATPAPTATPVSSAPSEPPAPVDPTPTAKATSSPSPDPDPTPTVKVTVAPTVEPSVTPTQSPEPTVAAVLAIATDIDVIGESAAFSTDGSWFAFTARPSDGSSGPDVYVWRVGDERAHALTSDGVTYFASWAGDELIASRPEDVGDDTSKAETVRIDPATGDERAIGELWRPIVDPTGALAIGWTGSIKPGTDDGTWTPARGALELRTWSADGPVEDSDHPADRIVTDKAAGDFDIRLDETGEWVATWVADPNESTIGRLTLYHVDVGDASLERVDGAPVAVPALPGFSIGDGRLAWATPPGQGGEGSRIQIAAWAAGDVGTVESTPGEGLVVVR
ncbi:MAG: zf-HC2 domain-containing protein [Candidatus Limnocylindrales bacterium]